MRLDDITQVFLLLTPSRLKMAYVASRTKQDLWKQDLDLRNLHTVRSRVSWARGYSRREELPFL
jgi:hypothetical protein